MPQILGRKLSWMALKPQNLRKFSPSKVSRYTVYNHHVNLDITQLTQHIQYSRIITDFRCLLARLMCREVDAK